ncbi:Hypp3159 [Branchiostoma lanceolatum]|uniref:Hypp3159 protein n=1 Tax=Branchiostoma lanceolatum TaxID=7740 RepID=A0A8K0EQW0_BRALA|nr:Hypp3159 [Branchiostoma lanceolatum]
MNRLQRTTLAVASVLLGGLDLALADSSCSLGKKIPVFGCTPNVLGMVAACLFVLILLTIGCCFFRGCRSSKKPKKRPITTVTGSPSFEAATTATFPVAPPPYSQEERPYTGARLCLVRPYPGAEPLSENQPQPVPGGPSTWTEPPPPYSPETKVPL